MLAQIIADIFKGPGKVRPNFLKICKNSMPHALWKSQKRKAAQQHVKSATLVVNLLTFITHSYAINLLQPPAPKLWNFMLTAYSVKLLVTTTIFLLASWILDVGKSQMLMLPFQTLSLGANEKSRERNWLCQNNRGSGSIMNNAWKEEKMMQEISVNS